MIAAEEPGGERKFTGWLPGLLVVVALTLVAIAIAGFHSGMEDDSIYLPGIKKLAEPGSVSARRAVLHQPDECVSALAHGRRLRANHPSPGGGNAIGLAGSVHLCARGGVMDHCLPLLPSLLG